MGKVLINPPSLPSSIRGDGRYVMTLLKNFVSTVSDQVNYINGFTEATKDDTIPVPKYFYLNFGSFGHEFSWTSVEVDNFDHYELRLNKNVGSPVGLLDRTTEIKGSPNLESRTGTIYLYVVLESGDYSSPYILNYAKEVPSCPENIAVSKIDEGTLIIFDAIPSDCIGAAIYVNGVRYDSSSNTFLFPSSAVVSDVLIAYYDSFGVGEFTDSYFDPPLVDDFFVERNGANLHFYWKNVDLYNCKYVIRRNTVPDWDGADLVAEVYTNSFNCVFPNDGTFYFLIKVYDEHGNTSDEASFVSLETVPDIYRNVIIENDRAPEFYGSLDNFVLEPSVSGIVLPAGNIKGTYIFSSHLPQKYRARNWLDVNAFSFKGRSLKWEDADFPWDSELARQSWVGSYVAAGDSVTSEISFAVGKEEFCIDSVTFDGSKDSYNGVVPSEDSGAGFKPCSFFNGVNLEFSDYLVYDINIPSNFGMTFSFKPTELSSGFIFELLGDNSFCVLYSVKRMAFVVCDSVKELIVLPVNLQLDKVLSIGISLFDGSLKFLVLSSSGVTYSGFCDYDSSCVYSKFIVGNKVEVIS